MGTAVYYGILAYSAYSAYESAEAQKEAGRKQKQAIETQQKQADIAAYRERIQAVRQARAQRGATLQAAQAQGVAGSTSTQGAVSSIGSQLGANLSFLDQTQALSRQTSIFSQQAVDLQTEANIAATRGQIAGSIFQQGYGYKQMGQDIQKLTS